MIDHDEHRFSAPMLFGWKQYAEQNARVALGKQGDQKEHVNWAHLTFERVSDIGPALLGRPMGPSEATACPELSYVEHIASLLRIAFRIQLTGEPGSGKSIAAFQVAKRYDAMSWTVLYVSDPSRFLLNLPHTVQKNILVIVDNAHLASPSDLENLERNCNSKFHFLEIHSSGPSSSPGMGSIHIDPKKSVKEIARAFLSDIGNLSEVVATADSDIGETRMKDSLPKRIEHAEDTADTPWQFCFILGGGWKRAGIAAGSAISNGSAVVLATLAAFQIASRDRQPERHEIGTLCRLGGASELNASEAVRKLVTSRLILSEVDLRTPHQRFAARVLDEILLVADEAEQNSIARVLGELVSDASLPLVGIFSLLDRLAYSKVCRGYWKGLILEKKIRLLLERCWSAESVEDRQAACHILHIIDAHLTNYPEGIYENKDRVISRWITSEAGVPGSGLCTLLNSLSREENPVANLAVEISDPALVAKTLNEVTPGSAFQVAELISGVRVAGSQRWLDRFYPLVDKGALLALAKSWPFGDEPFRFAKLCSSLLSIDEGLSLEMAEAHTEQTKSHYHDRPLDTFSQLHDLNMQVLRLWDPLGVYVGKLRPTGRHKQIARAHLEGLDARRLAEQISRSNLRELNDASGILAFLRRVNSAKYRSVVSQLDWEEISSSIGRHWKDLPHEAEVFFGVAFDERASGKKLKKCILEKMDGIEILPPRLAIIAPEVALDLVQNGRLIAIVRYQHVDWTFGPYVVALFGEERPELLPRLLQPYSEEIGKILSHRHPSWFKEAASFLQAVEKYAPKALSAILDAVEVRSAAIGWDAALRAGKSHRSAVSILIEAGIDRPDELGMTCRKLRKKFPRGSAPE
ncbi:hypothetical protein JQT66_09265 [Sulfitobacter mediterraneus]|uniref:hypothetical protein n=1 Tax=Sulfitobacter mediterraneus TaxID=83219 RepID=UPI001932E1EB|nr:hypothetical protein [Sulfitobacter mediterraneus]MBM1310353.1 hypothetical protein [Sulfitobacter mediterraneus]MBM1314237.1 hypothetical protein [Sulfitobacter mediterraneus]MBM1322597.1 hypothetical protein [Sulfitobacter mediterraneus]MBM1326509.1 hypothetical protein [Sulfitobacter mediterraneus]MBM1397855.1 hypothetical protein [Sulfitobacter mediterraneus]